MKKAIYILAVALMMPWTIMAQDGRNRLTTTVVADVLAQMPARDQSLYDGLMADLSGTGSEGVMQLADMLVPADKGANSVVEYALNGLVAYVSAPGREAEAAEVSDGLAKAIDKCMDNVNKSFMISLLGMCGSVKDCDVLVKYLADEYLSEPALKAIISIPGSEGLVRTLILQKNDPDAALARVVAAKAMREKDIEDRIVTWAQVAPVGQRRDFYLTLGQIGSQNSLKVLEKAAREADYEDDADAATAAYVMLLSDGTGNEFDQQLLRSARQLLKSNAPEYIKGAALIPVFALDGKKALPQLVKALESGERQYRVNALRLCEPWADDDVYVAINEAATKDSEVQVDVLNWYGTNHVESQLPYVTGCFQSDNPDVVASAIKTAAKIGGTEALDALTGLLGTANGDAAVEALLHFNGDIAPGVDKALDAGNDEVRMAAVNLAAKRHVHAVAPKIFKLVDDRNGDLSSLAYAALAGVAAAADFDTLVRIGRMAPVEKKDAVANAMAAALRPLDGERQYEMLRPCVADGGDIAIYFPALAQCGTPAAVGVLEGAYAKDDRKALEAMLIVDGNDMIPVLYEIALNDKDASVAALRRYASLVRKSGYDKTKLFDLYAKALAVSDHSEVQTLMLAGLAQSGVFPAITLAAGYIDNPATAMAAAEAVRSIASKNNFTGDEVVKALEAAKAFYKAEGSADSGYAVDDIEGLIKKCRGVAAFTLSPEEEAEGFEVLFDGTSMERWTGNKTAYTPLDGAIYVTAQYGGSGNLYTDKEYSDFIFRFEFCFDSPGVNNGVGIRTAHDVDAAYHGMEIQILDHDNPIYRDLNDYQVHGSVYGVIPAKRIVSPAQGVWNTEEIRAVGDRITVTVNGEVILDGNIRKACKGHNVSDDGVSPNPYTVDHQNHPGLFNKKGYISFCGHGPGIRFRNIRIKDLGKK